MIRHGTHPGDRRLMMSDCKRLLATSHATYSVSVHGNFRLGTWQSRATEENSQCTHVLVRERDYITALLITQGFEYYPLNLVRVSPAI